MDYDYGNVDNRAIFPPKRIWVWWDASGEYMDSTANMEEGIRWSRTSGGHIAIYDLKELVAEPK